MYTFTVVLIMVIAYVYWARRRARSNRPASFTPAGTSRSHPGRERLLAEASLKLPFLRIALDRLEQMEFIAASMLADWQRAHADAIFYAVDEKVTHGLGPAAPRDFVIACEMLRNLDSTVARHNRLFVERRVEEEKEAFDSVERYPLDPSQRRAIVTDQDTTLVVAGAGTGKTSTIVGKVDYLIRRGDARPDQILVLAFNNRAADELRRRLARLEAGDGVTVRTFHAFGQRVIAESTGTKPSVSRLAVGEARLKFIRDRLREHLRDPAQARRLVEFFATYLDEPREPLPETGDEYIRRIRSLGLVSLSGEKLKSREEVRIANWLTLNGIRWDYERTYPFPTADLTHRAYKPDFYLPEYDLYIEHFGIDRHGNTAPNVDATRYRNAMRWKVDTHHANRTRLISTYSYLESEGGLIPNLENLLRAEGVVPRPLSETEIAAVTSQNNHVFWAFVSLLGQFMAVYRGSTLETANLEASAASERDRAFVALFLDVHSHYVAALRSQDEIDFDDMVTMARSHITSGDYTRRYTHVIVDEFQDISRNRLELVRDLLAQVSGGRLFAVGDDWQSIYRFAGSDMALVTHLSDFAGPTDVVGLETVFRHGQSLVDASAHFIGKNPGQLQKDLRAHESANGGRRDSYPSVPLHLVFSPAAFSSGADEAFDTIAGLIPLMPGSPRTMLVLGRYNRLESSIPPGFRQAMRKKGVAVEFRTIHRSKGQEADYVVLLGLDSGDYGFPSNISDDAVMRMVLSDPEDFVHAEERRLFYVAITRARRSVFLIASRNNPSPFVHHDLLTEPIRSFVEVHGEESERYPCPVCQGLTVRQVNGANGAFWGCANYPLCVGKLPDPNATMRSPRSSGAARATPADAEACPKCGIGHLVSIKGRNGRFLGCSTWSREGGCTYTHDAP